MRYDSNRYDIELTYGSLSEGETMAGQICPACNGGSKKEGSLSVSRSGGVLLFNCHRASCQFSGYVGATPGNVGSTSSTKATSSNAYIPTTQLDAGDFVLLAEEFGLSRQAIELAGFRRVQATTGNYAGRLCFPIYGPDSRERGEVYRSYSGGYPKTITRLRNPDDLAFCWYIRRRASPVLVIVEDQISAVKVSEYYDSAALLGTNFSEAKVKEVKARGYKRIYLCLDNDATGVAVRLILKYRSALPQLQVIGLDKDIKNMDEEEFETFLAKLEG